MNQSHLFLNTYKRIPIEISRGEGVHLISKDGTRYLDFFSGIAVNALGHSHPKVIEAVTEQIGKRLPRGVVVARGEVPLENRNECYRKKTAGKTIAASRFAISLASC